MTRFEWENLMRTVRQLEPPAAEPLPESKFEQLKALALDWMDSPTHQMYGEILLERLEETS